jgi:hypothetical protein
MARTFRASIGKGLGAAVLACGWPTLKETVQAHEQTLTIQSQRIASYRRPLTRFGRPRTNQFELGRMSSTFPRATSSPSRVRTSALDLDREVLGAELAHEVLPRIENLARPPHSPETAIWIVESLGTAEPDRPGPRRRW